MQAGHPLNKQLPTFNQAIYDLLIYLLRPLAPTGSNQTQRIIHIAEQSIHHEFITPKA